MLGVLVFFVLCQQSTDPTRPAQVAEMLARAHDAAQGSHARDSNEHSKREFTARFNRLVNALKDFEEAYSRDAGQVWPAKQAAKLDSAMRELSNSPGWRKSD